MVIIIDSNFCKHLFLFRGFLKMKATFSFFSRNVRNPAPAKYYFKKNQQYYEILTNASKNYQWLLVIISEWFVWNYNPSWISEFVWTLRSSIWVVFNNFLLIDATYRSKISSDQKRLFFAVRLYPLAFFANTPLT